MTTNMQSEATSYTEAPASWNTRYVTPEGFVCQITVRGENGRDLLEKAGIALTFLLEHDYKPEANNNRHHRHNNKGQQGGKLCPIHRCEMKRFEKDGNAWFSHKTDDGNWCRGKQKVG
jgi:hypothetical protein